MTKYLLEREKNQIEFFSVLKRNNSMKTSVTNRVSRTVLDHLEDSFTNKLTKLTVC